MKAILLELDDLSTNDYDSFSKELKTMVSGEVTSAISKMVFDMRVTKLKKVVDQINTDTTGNFQNPDIVLELLRIEEE